MNSGEIQVKISAFTADIAAVKAHCNIKDTHKAYAIAAALLAEARALFCPCIIWRALPVQAVDEESLLMGGQRFISPLFGQHLQTGQLLYPFVASCGKDAENWAKGFTPNTVQRYIAEALQEMAAAQVRRQLSDTLQKAWQQQPSEYSPGTIPQLPLTLQQPLFALLQPALAANGISLNANCLMLPLKTVSGILFCREEVFFSCLLCGKKNCPQRRITP